MEDLKLSHQNMRPVLHEGRRKARAQALAKKFEGRTDVVYVDAAAYPTPKRGYAIAAVTEEGHLVANVTVRTNSPEIAEEAAIALALTNPQAGVIVSDSEAAIGNFAKGRLSPISLGILKNYPIDSKDVEWNWSGYRPTRHTRGMRQPTIKLEDLSAKMWMLARTSD